MVTEVHKLFRLRSECSLAHSHSGARRSSGRWKSPGTPCPGCSQATTRATSLSEPTSTQPEEHRSPKAGGNCVLPRLFPGLSQWTHCPVAQVWHSFRGVQRSSSLPLLDWGSSIHKSWPGDVGHFMGSRGRAFWNSRTLTAGWQDPKVSKAGKQMDQGHLSAQGDRKAQWQAFSIVWICLLSTVSPIFLLNPIYNLSWVKDFLLCVCVCVWCLGASSWRHPRGQRAHGADSVFKNTQYLS